MGKVMRHTLGASLNIRHNLSSSKGPKPLQLKVLTTYIPKTSAFTLAFSTSQRLRTNRASARTFFTFRHYITFFFYYFGDPRDLHSFPTRRSSDLGGVRRPRLWRHPHHRLCRRGAGGHTQGPLVPVLRHARAAGRHPALPRPQYRAAPARARAQAGDRKSTRLNSSHSQISYAVFCL